jgi:hypothetical protein
MELLKGSRSHMGLWAAFDTNPYEC